MESDSVKQLRAEKAELRAALSESNARCELLCLEVEKLRQSLIYLKRQVFGQKSERVIVEDDRQNPLFDIPAPEIPQTIEKIRIAEHERIKRGRKPLPSDLPRERIEYEPEERTCSCCGAELVKTGEEITEEIERVPARIVIREHVKIKRACSKCKGAGVKAGEIPEGIIPLPGSRPGIGLLVYIIISKYVDHLPLYRLEGMFRREGIEISRQRMSDWLAAVVPKHFEFLYRALLGELIAENYLKADETHIKVQDPDCHGALHDGYFWSLLSPLKKLALFSYNMSRSGDVAKELLKGFEGTLQSDAYAGYNPVIVPQRVSRIACMAHIRRKFYELRTVYVSECGHVISLIKKLYDVEAEAKKEKLSFDARKSLRDERSRPVLDELYDYIEKLHQSMLPKAALQEVINYALGEKEQMYRYLENGIFEIDNNSIEREIRPIAIGRKNYLFAGSHDGAQRAAILYSLIASCRLNNVNPVLWFTDVLRRIQSYPVNRLSELLPHNWKSLQAASSMV